MKVILLQDVKKVGKKDQIVEVSDGFAQNFLFSRHLAVQLSNKSREILSNQQEDARLKDLENKRIAEEDSKKLETITLNFKSKAGKDGKMFGSISTKQIEEELTKFGIKIDKRNIIDKNPINVLGYHKIKVNLYKGIVGTINIHVEEE